MTKRTEPDEILKQIVKLSSGRHKIFLGMAPGVGKTYRMLEEANELKRKGVDIIIGYIENQNRPENNTLIQAHEIIQKKAYKINNKEFYDLDLDSIIERRPATVVIDELAHNNLPGSLNQKRYQDIQELLRLGISVLSTLNIHQLESIAPIIEKNVGIKVNERIPDWILHQADEVVLIDIPIDELYARLESKRIYTPEQLKQGAKFFFKRNNLMLLRDFALSILAERVDAEVVSEKLSAKIKQRILVVASPSENSIKLIEHAGTISKTSHTDVDILCIIESQPHESVINKLREASKITKANFLLIKDLKRSLIDEIINFIRANRITLIIIGTGDKKNWKSISFNTLITQLLEKTHDIDLLMINHQQTTFEPYKSLPEVRELISAEPNQKFGKLKIYIGMAPGVGKTYKMLQDAKEMHQNKINVLLGVIDTHGRPETAALLEGLQSLPFKLIEHKGKYFQEFDLEAAILAKPEYILVDELAHTNVPGAINNKRYQDVQYLLRAGINVLTTVNIQHIESLNDLVEEVTGIKVRETVPDWIISHATEIALIDLSPEALQERLKAGKIYSLDKIEQALTHFFQKKNLIALRELSLREVAENVEHEMYPIEKKPKILCFIDVNQNTLRLVRKSARIANRLQAELIVMHIIKNTKELSEKKKMSIIELEQLIVELGGDFRLVEGKNIIEEISKAEVKIQPEYIITGEVQNKKQFFLFKEPLIKKIITRVKQAHTWIIGDYTKELQK